MLLSQKVFKNGLTFRDSFGISQEMMGKAFYVRTVALYHGTFLHGSRVRDVRSYISKIFCL